MTKGSPHVTEELSIHVSNKILAHICTSQWADYLKMQRTKQLTSIDLLQRDVLLQQSTEFDLRAVLPAGSVVCEDEVGMAVVEHSQLAQWVCHRLIGSCYLEQVIRRDITLKGLLFKETTCWCKCPYIFSNEVFFVFKDPPWSNPYSTHLST